MNREREGEREMYGRMEMRDEERVRDREKEMKASIGGWKRGEGEKADR